MAGIKRVLTREELDMDRDAVIEECAKVLDKAADDWRRIRDPGMANNAASYARQIRALKSDAADQKRQPLRLCD